MARSILRSARSGPVSCDFTARMTAERSIAMRGFSRCVGFRLVIPPPRGPGGRRFGPKTPIYAPPGNVRQAPRRRRRRDGKPRYSAPAIGTLRADPSIARPREQRAAGIVRRRLQRPAQTAGWSRRAACAGSRRAHRNAPRLACDGPPRRPAACADRPLRPRGPCGGAPLQIWRESLARKSRAAPPSPRGSAKARLLARFREDRQARHCASAAREAPTTTSRRQDRRAKAPALAARRAKQNHRLADRGRSLLERKEYVASPR